MQASSAKSDCPEIRYAYKTGADEKSQRLFPVPNAGIRKFFQKGVDKQSVLCYNAIKGDEEDTRRVVNVIRESAAGVSRCQTILCIPSEPER